VQYGEGEAGKEEEEGEETGVGSSPMALENDWSIIENLCPYYAVISKAAE
jgi:hypothetical protein